MAVGAADGGQRLVELRPADEVESAAGDGEGTDATSILKGRGDRMWYLTAQGE